MELLPKLNLSEIYEEITRLSLLSSNSSVEGHARNISVLAQNKNRLAPGIHQQL